MVDLKKTMLWIEPRLTQTVPTYKQPYHCGVMYFGVFQYICVIRDDIIHPLKGGGVKRSKPEEQSLANLVTIATKPAWWPYKTLSTRGSHHTVPGDSEVVATAAWVSREKSHWHNVFGDVLRPWMCCKLEHTDTYFQTSKKKNTATGDKKLRKKMMIIKGTVRWWRGGGDLF